MPTGYTAPILDGEIDNFKDFAKRCMRNFGATIHMRDDSLTAEYVKREPSEYHLRAIKEYKEKIVRYQTLTDEEILEEKRNSINDNIDYHIKKIKECEDNHQKLTSILTDVENWTPPTPDHSRIKEFMIEQITITIEHDADSTYHEDEIERYSEKLNNLNVEEMKRDFMEDTSRSLDYHIKNHNEELKRVDDSNRWVEVFLNSL